MYMYRDIQLLNPMLTAKKPKKLESSFPKLWRLRIARPGIAALSGIRARVYRHVARIKNAHKQRRHEFVSHR